jgi:hypothetical protein
MGKILKIDIKKENYGILIVLRGLQMSIGEIVIKVESDLSEDIYEILEDAIRNLMESKGISANINDSVTGNNIKTRKRMMRKNRNELLDQTIQGRLIFGEKIWFNDDLRCRLRICGFTQEQIKELKTAKYVDLTLTDFIDRDTSGVVVSICGWGTKEKGNLEEICE